MSKLVASTVRKEVNQARVGANVSESEPVAVLELALETNKLNKHWPSKVTVKSFG